MTQKTAQKTSYVGQMGVQLAAEYYECDFDWQEHAQVAAQVVMRQEALATASLACSSSAGQQPPEGGTWESFYQQHAEARFYKLRRYILREFPLLALPGPAHIMEIGCGCGSSMLPVLAANPEAVATVTDVSPTCIAQLRVAAEAMGIDAGARIASAFACDSTDPGQAPRFEGIGADYLLIMFTLSAVAPPQQLEMLRNAFRALRPGGCLMLRDHGLYDMVQAR